MSIEALRRAGRRLAGIAVAIGISIGSAGGVRGPTTAAEAGEIARPNALPDLRIARASNDIAEVWLADPTTRYRHFVLGSSYEASSLVVRTKSGKVVTLSLSDTSVFEDREPRLADLDGDGRDEIVVVRSYLDGGAALSVYGLRDGKLVRLAETPDMGHPFGWLNPAGIADFDGDGAMEILFVRKPHVLGRLEMWRLASGKLKRILTHGNTSNHIGGTKHLRLWAIADFDGDGVTDLAIPSFDRRAVRFLSFKGSVREVSRKRLSSRARGDFKLVSSGARNGVNVGLSGGRRVTIFP